MCIYDLTQATPNLAHQAEDHCVYPLDLGTKNVTFTQSEMESIDDDSKKIRFSTTWRTNDREYYGQSYNDNNGYISRR